MNSIKLIGEPDFFKEYKNSDFYNFNILFWDYIFDYKSSFQKIDINKLEDKDKLEVKNILINLKLSKNIFELIKEKKVGVRHIVFAFEIIYKYLNLLNKLYSGEKIFFYNYFKTEKSIDTDVKNSIFYNFFENYNNIFFESLENGDTIKLDIEYSYQISQLVILNKILKERNIKGVTFSIFLGGLVWFESKKFTKQIILDKFKNVKFDNKNSTLKLNYLSILGEKYYKFMLFDYSCSWNKCKFCNIGKNPKISISKQERFKSFIGYVKKEKIKNIQLSDPSLDLEDLLKLSDTIIDNQLDLNIKVFTRFSEEYNDKNLKKLAEAGFKFLGIGLETTSSRLNKLMGKYDKDYSKNNFEDLVKKSNKYGIRIHYYSMFGLPTEKYEEIVDLKDFLKDQINNNDFFSFTASIFGLNKGSELYLNKEKYGIKFREKKLGDETFISDYSESNFDEHYDLLVDIKRTLVNDLFFNGKQIVSNSIAFWYFIEHSNIFHVQKLIFKSNPFLNYYKKTNEFKNENG